MKKLALFSRQGGEMEEGFDFRAGEKAVAPRVFFSGFSRLFTAGVAARRGETARAAPAKRFLLSKGKGEVEVEM